LSRIKADPDHASDNKRTAKYGAGKIEVVTGTVWQAPPHAGKQVKPFGDVDKDHDRQTNEPKQQQRASDCHRPQSSSASRFTAGAFGFLTLIQCLERPDRYSKPTRFD